MNEKLIKNLYNISIYLRGGVNDDIVRPVACPLLTRRPSCTSCTKYNIIIITTARIYYNIRTSLLLCISAERSRTLKSYGDKTIIIKSALFFHVIRAVRTICSCTYQPEYGWFFSSSRTAPRGEKPSVIALRLHRVRHTFRKYVNPIDDSVK